MDAQEKKQIILGCLKEQAEPTSLPNLLDLLGHRWSQRSLRRWLTEMIEDGLVEKSGQGRATRYQLKDLPPNQVFNPQSLPLIEKVRRPIYERQPAAYNENWFNVYQPNHTFYLPAHLKSQLHDAGKRSHNVDPAGTYARHIFNRLLIDLSFNSSRLEGNTYSLLDTKRLLLEGAIAAGKLDEEKMMILNHKEAIRYLVDHAHQLEINRQTICTLHYLLSSDLVEPEHSGKVRNIGVRIGGSTYIPFEDPKRLQTQLEQICKKASLIEDPFEQSLFLLIHITYLQAFSDVNKRTARLSANIPLIKSNFVPLSFNDVERDDYISAMIAIYELQQVSPIIDLFVFSYLRTCTMYETTVEALGFDEIRVRYRQDRRAVIREIILKKLTDQLMYAFILKSSKNIPEGDRNDFIEDIYDDLKLLDYIRIAGLGITPQQLDEWQRL